MILSYGITWHTKLLSVDVVVCHYKEHIFASWLSYDDVDDCYGLQDFLISANCEMFSGMEMCVAERTEKEKQLEMATERKL